MVFHGMNSGVMGYAPLDVHIQQRPAFAGRCPFTLPYERATISVFGMSLAAFQPLLLFMGRDPDVCSGQAFFLLQ